MIAFGRAWALPMYGARAAGLAWPFYVAAGCLWGVVAAFAGPLYDLGIRVRRGLGMTKLAEWSEGVKPRILPPARAALAVMALVSFAFVLL